VYWNLQRFPHNGFQIRLAQNHLLLLVGVGFVGFFNCSECAVSQQNVRISDVACSLQDYMQYHAGTERLERGSLLKLRQMGTQSVKMKGVLPLLVRLVLHAGTRGFCPAVAALFSPIKNILFFTVHYFNTFVPSSSKLAGSRAGSPVS
jgi:hypothetical protein